MTSASKPLLAHQQCALHYKYCLITCVKTAGIGKSVFGLGLEHRLDMPHFKQGSLVLGQACA
jgi:hypothetical protein